jgi:hypothetical protein
MDKLNVLWTMDNKDTVLNMLVMYATNSRLNGWRQEVNVIIWGASAKLVGTDTQIQAEVLEMLNHGITIEACKASTDNFDVTYKLTELGVNVRYTREVLTNYLKSGEKILTL